MNIKAKLITFIAVVSGLLFYAPSLVSAQGTFDCGWTTITGSPAACRALNMNCESGFEANYALCGNLTTQGEVVCEARKNINCVAVGTGAVAASGSATTTSQVWFDQHNPLQWYVKVFDDSSTPANEVFGERYTAAQVQWVLFSLPAVTLNQILGRDIMVCVAKAMGTGDLSACVDLVVQKVEGFINPFSANPNEPARLATNDKNYWIKFFASKQISGVGYVINKSADLHIIPTAQAQALGGFGYTKGANPVLNLWRAVRNISFMLLAIVTVVFSFLIMFRVKLSPQVVVSIQSALPKIVIAMVLITFSYAIAGLLIDLMYVVIALISALLTSADPQVTNFTTIDLFDRLTDGETVLGLVWRYLAVFYFAVVSILGVVGTALASTLLLPLMALFSLFMSLVVFFNGLKLIWLTIKTFASLLLAIVFGPLQILFGTISPTNGVGKWIVSIVSNLAVFPVIGVMFFLSFYLASQASGGIASNTIFNLFPFGIQAGTGTLASQGWEPPLSFGTDGAKFLWLMASYAVFAMIPKAGELAKSMFGGGKFSAGTAIGESTAAGIAPISSTFGKFQGAYEKSRLDSIFGRVGEAGKVASTAGPLIERIGSRVRSSKS